MKRLSMEFGRAAVWVAVGSVCLALGIGLGRLPAWDQLAASITDTHPSGGGEGVKVHGHWKFTVLEADRVISEREFENELVTVAQTSNGGDAVLARLLTRSDAMGPWQLYAADANGTLLFQLSSAADIAQQNVQGPLTVSGATPAHVILSGNYTAGSNISIGKVSTSVSMCGAASAPNSCVNYFGDFFFNFTARTLQTPVQVAAGQIVQVTVDIGFS